MSISTKRGDAGQTGLAGHRVSKLHIRVAAYGTVDQLNASLGWARSICRIWPRLRFRLALRTARHHKFVKSKSTVRFMNGVRM